MITSMRMINCDEHIQISDLLVKLNYYIALFYYESMGLDTYTFELSKLFGSINLFYHRLEHLYSILDEDGYFDEDD
jgi:hypothetical protein